MALLTAHQSTSIRPLGEEHLRMFRRIVGYEPEKLPRITLEKVSVFLTEESVGYEEVWDVVDKYKGRLATVIEAVMDKALIKDAYDGGGRGERSDFFVSWEYVPAPGFYRIDRKKRRLMEKKKADWDKLEWHERLRVDVDDFFRRRAEEEQRPLSALVYNADGGGVQLSHTSADSRRVAITGKGRG